MDSYLPKIPKGLRMDSGMSKARSNPFSVTKAVDFSDQEIHDYWVDMSDNAFMQMVKPHSPMPIIILGGKGSGKTHLMRHFSYSLQKIRHPNDIASGIREDGYIGIYFRCSGLNAARFSGKRQPDERWAAIFEYYMELWFAQLFLRIIIDAFSDCPEFGEIEPRICESVMSLFDIKWQKSLSNLNDIESILRDLQKEIDLAINNCPITGELKVDIKATRGHLVFGIPKVVADCFPLLEGILFLYLIDEFENLNLQQQKYINTLVREKQLPTSFRIGSRLYGIKTLSTYSDNEENREGSEHETIHLDELLRQNRKHYRRFSTHLIAKRLSKAGFITHGAAESDRIDLTDCFETFPESQFAENETAFIIEKYSVRDRPYFKTLRRKLEDGMKMGVAEGVASSRGITGIIKDLAVPHYPLLEKANILLLYQDWHKREDLIKSASQIRQQCSDYLAGNLHKGRHKQILSHFGSDLLAQLYRECGQ